ncbi:MAG: PAS domain S-box protein, partial [Desulfosudaceae bacterium]
MGEHSRETNDERFRLIFTYLPTAAALVDESGRLQQVNPALGRLLGYRLEELAGRKLEDFLQPHDLNAKLLVAPPRYEQTEFSSVEETRILCRDGRSLWARLHVSWIPGDSDRRPLAVITWAPLAASTRTAVSRGKSRERYQALFDQFADEVYLHDGDGTILDLNQAAVNGSGYSRRELLGMTVFDLHPPDTDPADVRRQWKQWPVGRSHTLEYRHQRRDGSIYPVEITTGAVAINRQRLFLAIVRDITRRWRKEIEYAHILNTSLDGYWLLDAEGRLLEANPAAAEILGYPQGTLTGLTINDIEAEETA